MIRAFCFLLVTLGLQKRKPQGPTLSDWLASRCAQRDALLRARKESLAAQAVERPAFADSYFAETCSGCGRIFDAEVEGAAPWVPTSRRPVPVCGFCLSLESLNHSKLKSP